MLPSTSLALILSLISTSTAFSYDDSSRSSKNSRVRTLHRKRVVNSASSDLLTMASTLQASTTFVACEIAFQAAAAVDSIGGILRTESGCHDLLSAANLPIPIIASITTPIVTIATTHVSNPSIPTYIYKAPSATLAVSQKGPAPVVAAVQIVAPIVAVAATAPIVESIPCSSSSVTTCSSSKTLACSSKEQALSIHNVARARHGVQPLVWDNSLEEAAAKWANKCEWAHSPVGSLFPASYHYGENMYASTSSTDSLSTAVESFLIEENFYDYSAEQFDPTFGQFTQVIWKGTQKVGCASVQCGLRVFQAETNLSSLSVCLYYPAGNVNTQTAFSTNILPIHSS